MIVEFTIITREVEKYHTLKAEIRAGGRQSAVTPDVATQTQAPDLEKLKDEPSNYRPISLLSIFNRLFEKVML